MKIKALLLLVLSFLLISPTLWAQCNLTGYTYRLPVTINNNNTSVLTNHQVRLTFNTQSLVSAGKMLANGNDIRFTDSLCNNLSYWIESGMNSATTVIWVKVPNIPATGRVRVFMNYGNNASVAASNGDSTFLLFDDFTSTTFNTSKWTNYISGGSSSISQGSGVLTIVSNDMAEVVSNISLPVPYHSEIKVNSLSGTWPSLAQLHPSAFTGITLFTDNSQMHLNSTSASCVGYSGYFSNASLINGIGIWSMSWISQNDYRATWPGSSTSGTSNSQAYTITPTLRTAFGPLCTGSGSMVVDWVRARKYAAVTPTFTIGTEELNRRAFNDVGVSALNTPVVNFCAGIQSISVRVNNYGINAVNNLMVNWSINGSLQLPVTYTNSIDTMGSVAGNTAIVNLGSYNFTNTPVTIRAWTSNPNSGLDTVRTNDSTTAVRVPSMGGTYTIGPTGNYTSFTAAINDLKSRGICSPTTLNIAPGTYYEQVDFDGQVPGASSVNTITFSGASASNTVLTYNSSLNTARHTFRLANTSFVTVQNLRIQSTGVNYGWPVLITGASSDLTIKKCSVDVGGTVAPTSTSFEFMGLVISGSNSNNAAFITADRITIDSNTFINGNSGIYTNSTPGAGSLNMRIRGNTFLYQDIAIQVTGIDNPTISMNTIRLRNSANSTYGIYMASVYPASSGRNVTITGNKITGFNTYGIYIFGANHPTGTKGLLANNMIGGNVRTNTSYGISLESSNRWMVYNNSIHMDNTYSNVNSYANLFLSSSNNVSIVNNIFSRTQASLAYCAYITGSTIDTLTYNQFFKPDTATTSPLYLNGVNYNANNIRTLNTGNFVEMPSYTNDTTLAISVRCNNGIALAPITTDADGELRNNPPDIGADEAATFNNDVSVAAVVSPTNPTVAGLNDIRVRIRNTGSNVLTAARITYRLNNGPPRIFNWTGALNSCDTTTVTFSGLNQGIFNQGVNNLLVYTELPNNTFDNNRSNDTLRTNLFTAMGGTYTIGGPAPDFATFADAVTALQNYGIVAPVVFSVAAGTYNEQLTLNSQISGASATNTITFDGGDGNKDTRILSFSNTTGTSVHTVLLNNTRYIRLRNLTIRNEGTSYGIPIVIANANTRNIQVKNCNIEITGNGLSSSSNFFSGIILSGSTTTNIAARIDSVQIDSNVITGGYYGYYGSGTTGALALNNTFRNNVVTGVYYAGVFVGYQENIKITGNTIKLRIGASNNYGVYITVCSPALSTSNIDVSANRISGFAYCGIYISTSNGINASNKGIISNNMIGGNVSSTTAIGVYLTSSSRWYLYHNTINMDNPNTANTNAAALYVSATCTQISVMNNIFARTKSGNGHTIYALSTGNFDVFNYNHFYKVDTALGIMYLGSTTYYPATFRGANGWNVNSFFRPTSFVNDTNLMITNQCNHGLYMGGYTYDIDNKSRNNPPDVGAYEITGIANEMAPEVAYAPVAPVVPDYRYVSVRVRNNGNNAIYAGMLRYIVNNGTPVDTIWNATILPCDTALIQIRLLIPNGASTVKVISVFPNGFNDGNTANDTTTLNIMTSMSGVYTIGGINPNFNTFTQAVAAMNTAGVAGPITFNVRNGVYNEQVNLNAISGVTALNTVTFRAESGNRNQVVLNYAATSAGDNYVVRFNGASHIRFKNMTLTASGNGSYGTVILFNNNAANDSIDNCRLISQVTTSTTTDFAVVNINNTRCDNISITNSSLLNGSFGVYAQSNILSNYMLNTNLSNDSIVDQYYVGVNLNSVNNANIQNNLIASTSVYPAYIGVYLSYCNTGVVSRNRINVQNGGAGIYQTNCNGNLGTQYAISNNSISVNGASTSSYGIYSLYCSFHNFYNNSILVYGNGSFSYGAYLYYTSSSYANNQFKNNVVSNQGGGYAYYTYSTAYCNSDYNNFFGTGSNLVQTGAPNSSYTSLLNWKTASGKDYNSISYRPGFTSNTNLTPLASDSATWSLNGRGEQLTAVANDINGNVRSTTLNAGAPDLGAYEFTPTSLPPAATANPATPVAGVTQVFLFGSDTVASITWAPASIVPPSITLRQYSGIYHPNAGAGNILNNYVQATATGNNLNYTMRLYYKNTWLGTNPNESVLRLSKYNAAQGWTNYLNATSAVDEVRNIITASGLNSFSDFTGTNNNNPVPVTLLSQRIGLVNGYPVLKWTTATEKNASHFVVERSQDGKRFTEAGKVKATGNSAVLRNYQFTDYNNPITANSTWYYRLNMVDMDGSSEYAPVMLLEQNNQATPAMEVFPNPFTDNLNLQVQSNTDHQATVTLFDLQGKQLASITMPVETGSQQLNLSSLMPETSTLQTGLYLLQVTVNGQVSTVKISKK